MLFRKPSPTPPLHSLPSTTSFSKTKDPHNNNNKLRYTLFSCLILASWILFLHHHTRIPPSTDTCHGSGPLFYIHTLPSRFNLGLLQRCHKLNVYTNMCPHVANNGLGQPLSTPSWYATHQFIAEMIVHARLQNHPCRTWDPHAALLFYVPFYGGLHASTMFREPNHTLRDSLAVDLVHFLQSQPSWKRNNGKDHFVALGRTAWDFMRAEDGADFGANIFLKLPPVRNMSVLTVERQPWKGANQFGIPYPSYFHPKTLAEMLTWQNSMRQRARPHLFSFVGGTRKGLEKAKVRDDIVRQCGDSKRCVLVRCASGGDSRCHDPMKVLEVMSSSKFCLQAAGDSFTRRSSFDSVVAGCVPVFFSEHTAYTQYAWYLPAERGSYSVLIEEREVVEGKRSIEEILMSVSEEEVERMREVVIGLIPTLTYAHPNATNLGFPDVVDVALQQLSRRVKEEQLISIS
ncbi:probable xyloglucan galactosyltransferase GT17 [Cajanus cajan]|uniref:Xyloglucan galactosyltransferase KATAMARI1 isogeny n=1 Tax=Cajanus cajan TaxID=3821 RepID=A0A151TEK6_CAJCA|nr:probable xyloglucan galactosyltransferase GT17 [Cajanus cajan]KYP65436.1 Xyloglucan galactosyltransferase KATAMARI1 isogeny [Cajanus cajan]